MIIVISLSDSLSWRNQRLVPIMEIHAAVARDGPQKLDSLSMI